MKIVAILVVFATLCVSSTVAFSPPSGTITSNRYDSVRKSTKVTALPVDIVHVQMQEPMTTIPAMQQQSVLNDGVRSYVNNYNNNLQSTLMQETSTMTLSLKERPPPPTKEEIEAKKRNFNLWFWGGGFVAPFLATFYYFGFKFWEK